MSGQSRKTCQWFAPGPGSERAEGECMEPGKRIHYRNGDHVNDAPLVLGSCECCCHTGLETMRDHLMAAPCGGPSEGQPKCVRGSDICTCWIGRALSGEAA